MRPFAALTAARENNTTRQCTASAGGETYHKGVGLGQVQSKGQIDRDCNQRHVHVVHKHYERADSTTLCRNTRMKSHKCSVTKVEHVVITTNNTRRTSPLSFRNVAKYVLAVK